MKNFDEMAKEQYNKLIEQKKQLENELKPLKKYLEAKGLITKKRRKSRKAKETEPEEGF